MRSFKNPLSTRTKYQKTPMKNPKCLNYQEKTELVTCYCSEPQKRYFCWNCRQHYPFKK